MAEYKTEEHFELFYNRLQKMLLSVASKMDIEAESVIAIKTDGAIVTPHETTLPQGGKFTPNLCLLDIRIHLFSSHAGCKVRSTIFVPSDDTSILCRFKIVKKT